MSNMMDLRFKCEELRQLNAEKDALEERLTEINKRIDEVRMREIPPIMDSLQLKNATFEKFFPDGRSCRVQLASDLFASTKEGQKGAAMQWLKDCGYEDMIQETYNASTLKALFRRLIEQGAEIPDEIFNINPFTRASLVRA